MVFCRNKQAGGPLNAKCAEVIKTIWGSFILNHFPPKIVTIWSLKRLKIWINTLFNLCNYINKPPPSSHLYTIFTCRMLFMVTGDPEPINNTFRGVIKKNNLPVQITEGDACGGISLSSGLGRKRWSWKWKQSGSHPEQIPEMFYCDCIGSLFSVKVSGEAFFDLFLSMDTFLFVKLLNQHLFPSNIWCSFWVSMKHELKAKR